MNSHACPQARIRPSERGLTLIELMLALLVASLMMGLVLSIYTRMSVAYRNQSEVSELQQVLRGAKMRMVQDIRAAGHLIPNGFKMLSGGVEVERTPIEIVNDQVPPRDKVFEADLIRVFYADTSAMAAVVDWGTSNFDEITVDDIDQFAISDLIVAVNPKPSTGAPPGVAEIIQYDACLLEITNLIAPDKIGVQGASDFNSADNNHCHDALTKDIPTRPNRPMVYRMASRAYRIDPDPDPKRRAAGVLQMSPSGGLRADDWQDIGIGFTDLQVAVRYFDDDSLDQDGDGDALRDWYSSATQPTSATAKPLELSLSLVLRTTQPVDMVATSRTPHLQVNTNILHNNLGDSEYWDLDATADSARPLQYRGNHVYRWFTARIDLRNLGVGL